MVSPERYEFKNDQWDRIAPFFPPYRTSRLPKLDNRTVFNAILWIIRSGALGGTYLNVMVLGKQSIVAFVLGLLRVYLSDYSKNFVTLLTWKIQVWIQLLSGITRRLQVQKTLTV